MPLCEDEEQILAGLVAQLLISRRQRLSSSKAVAAVQVSLRPSTNRRWTTINSSNDPGRDVPKAGRAPCRQCAHKWERPERPAARETQTLKSRLDQSCSVVDRQPRTALCTEVTQEGGLSEQSQLSAQLSNAYVDDHFKKRNSPLNLPV